MRKSEDSDHPVRTESINRAFILQSHILLSRLILLADSEGLYQTDAQDDLGHRCPHTPKGTFSDGGAAHLL